MADNPYLSLQRFPGDGVTTDWNVSFAGNRPDSNSGTTPYIGPEDVIAYEVTPATLLTPEVTVDREVEYIGPNIFRVSPPVPVGKILVIRRKTQDQYNLVDFQGLQTVAEFDLDQANRQLLFLTQESVDQATLAEEKARDAESIAYSSVNNATLALETSETALDVAEAAASTAGSAASQAAIAVQTANSASVVADAANSTANTALANASTAVSTANSATATANAADSKADTAIATANGASSVALAASQDAADALLAAEAAEVAAAAAQASAAATEGLAEDAFADAAAALATANAIDGKAQEALDNSAYASGRADLAMSLVEEAGVQTWNGRAGAVVSVAGDYSADMITHGAGTVADALEDQTEYNSQLLNEINTKTNQVATNLGAAIDAVNSAKLDVSGTAVNSQRLGNQLPSHFATAAQLAAGLDGKLGKNDQATSAQLANKLSSSPQINGVKFDGTQSITVEDDTKLPLAGGTLTGTLGLQSGVTVSGESGMGLRTTFNGQWHRIGSRNTSYTHYESSTGAHYFYGSITSQGDVKGYSDIRLKTDIELIRNPLEKLSLLGGYTYLRTDLEDSRQVGVLAQQVRAVLPEAVREDEDGLLTVSYNGLVALLVEAVNDLAAKVKELENGLTK